jgi:hypothetical protein
VVAAYFSLHYYTNYINSVSGGGAFSPERGYFHFIEYHPWLALFITLNDGISILLVALLICDLAVFLLSGNAGLVGLGRNLNQRAIIFHSSFNTVTNGRNINVGEFHEPIKNVEMPPKREPR